MRHDESRLVLHVQIAAELQGAYPFDRVHKNGNRRQIVPDRQFAAGEDRARGNRELVVAAFAFPNLSRGVGVDRRAFAPRAVRSTAVGGEPDGDEPIVRFIISHAKDRAQGERPGLV